MAWVGTTTWTALLVILRALVGESAAAYTDANLLACANAAILSARGKLFIPRTRADLAVVTGTIRYPIPCDFAYIDEVRTKTGARLPDYAWELALSVDGCDCDAEIIFNSSIYATVTGTNPTLHGWKAQPVLAGTGTEYVSIDMNYVLHETLAYAHSSLGAGSSEWATWHASEHGKHATLAQDALKNAMGMGIYRPGPLSRQVPGRISGQPA